MQEKGDSVPPPPSPVSGALQLKTSGAKKDRPITSHSGAYSALLSPAPSRQASPSTRPPPQPP